MNAPVVTAPIGSPIDISGSEGRDGAEKPVSKPSVKLYSIQYLRAIAALMVVLHHSIQQCPAVLHVRLTQSLQSGVDIFFVISGFVMVFMSARTKYSPWRFMEMRIVRIVPVYWFYTFLAAILLLVAPGLFRANELSWRHFLMSLFFIPHTVAADPGNVSPIVKQGWTLDHEMFFYLLFAVAIAASQRLRVKLCVSALVLLAALGVFIKFMGWQQWLGGHAGIASVANPIILEFGMGMLLGAAYLRGALKSIHKYTSLALIVLGFAAILATGPTAINTRLVFYGIPALAIVTGALSLDTSGMIKLYKPFLRIGDASYSIYLVQQFPIALLRSLWGKAHMPRQGVAMFCVFVIACMAVATMIGIGSYLLVEKPSLKYLRNLIDSSAMLRKRISGTAARANIGS
jgi:exopolysaccharide production protein ExoZ